MPGDISRDTSLNAHREGYSRVLMQQGRVQLDADWNEQAELTHHRNRTMARDAFGPAGVPAETPDGFRIAAGTDQGDFGIGAGRIYVDGLLVENHEPRTYRNQPFIPNPRTLADILQPEQIGLVFLRVFERHVTALEDDRLRERALGGADTTTRVQTVGRVEVMPLPAGTSPDDIRRMVGDRQPLGFLLPPPTTGALEARVREPAADDPARPCLLSPEAGYLAQENQLYRVEVHRGGDRSTMTIKWSRENGSVVARVAAAGGTELEFEDDPRVNEDDFPTGGWVELIDRASDDAGATGHLALLNGPAGQRGITLEPPPPQGISTLADPRLRRWDQRGPSPRLDNGVSVTDDWTDLENGIQIRFTSGTYRSGEYWLIPARTATGTIEWPPAGQPGDSAAPVRPFGGNIHFCPLALINRDGRPLDNGDLRLHFPPLTNLRPAQQSTTQIVAVAPMLLPIESSEGVGPTSTPNFLRSWFHRLGYAFAPLRRDCEGWMSVQLPRSGRIQGVRFVGRNESVANLGLSLFRLGISEQRPEQVATLRLRRRTQDATEFDRTVSPGTVVDLAVPPGPINFPSGITPVLANAVQEPDIIDTERFRYVFHAFLDRPEDGAARPIVWLFSFQIIYTTG